ncbi:hypothetical protein [Modestobacter sp. Leaf380]|uniref:hypothetical protein n=1 Tax=Modestobacter sp. Leaf380 TaxID=1736356 RepID=UPI0012F7A037|nr:hypothetical protein [Modestobacter sp. Leaf380]
MGDAATWTAAVVAALALVVSIVALRWARQSAVAAEASAVAARDAADAARDDADVAIRGEQAQLRAQEEAAVTWFISWPGTSTVLLENVGAQTAHHVEVVLSPHGGSAVPSLRSMSQAVYPGGGMRIDVRHHTKTGTWLEVSWRLSDDLQEAPRTKRLGLGRR